MKNGKNVDLSHANAFAGGGFGLARRGLFLYFSETQLEHFGDVEIVLCTCLDPSGLILRRQIFPFVWGHLSKVPRLQVVLGTDYDTRDRTHAAKINDFVIDDLDHLERLS